MTDIKERLRDIESLHPADLWTAIESRRVSDAASVQSLRPRARVMIAGVALAISFVTLAVLIVAFRGSDARVPGQGIGTSYIDHGVPVTYQVIAGTLHRTGPAVTITQGTGEPGISQRDAVDIAWKPVKHGERPGQIVTAFVNWNGTPVWIVSLQGGNVCTPVYGPATQSRGDAVCVNFSTARIDASSGSLLDRFSDGHPVPRSRTASTPVPSLVDILEGRSGPRPSPFPATPSPAVPDVYFPPTFAGAADDGWHIRDSGFAKNGEGSTAWASTTAFDPADIASNAPAIPYNTVAALPADGIVIVAEVTPWAFDPANGPWPDSALQPLDLSQAHLRSPVAEEPPGNYSVLEVDNHYTSVRVYFGGGAPSADLVRQAQDELDRLRVPPVCPSPGKGVAYEAKLSAESGAPGDTVTISGPMPIQAEDGTFDQSNQTRIVAWWNAPPSAWADLAPGSTAMPSPAGPGPLVRLGEGGLGACSFSISFTVPQAPPGIYPIVPLEQNSGSATALPTLMFRVVS